MRFLVTLLFVSFFACRPGSGIESLVEQELAQREGNPALFFVNDAPFSVDSFRREARNERAVLRNEFQPMKPAEMEKEIQRYIEETIMLREALAQSDLDSAEARDFIWPYLRQALIRYYLEKKSGSLDLNKNYQDLTVPDEVIRQMPARNPDGKRVPAEDQERLLNSAVRLKWEKLHAQARVRQEALIADMKKRNKVRLIPQELYKPEE